MKTTKELIQALPLSIREKFIHNIITRGRTKLETREYNLASAIDHAFVWASSREGSEFWSSIHTQALSDKFKEQIPYITDDE